jgi:hypothetical protein
MCPLNRRPCSKPAQSIGQISCFLSPHHFVPGVLDVGLVEAMTRFPPLSTP